MDRPVEKTHGLSRRTLIWLALGTILLVGTALLYPSISKWAKAERSVERSRVRIGKVVRGNLERDVSVQGRIVAAFYPKLFSPAQGIVTLRVRSGEQVGKDQVLVTVESPEMESELQQELSTLESLRSEPARQEILARQTNLENQQQIDLDQVKLDAARRELERFRLLHEDGLVNRADFEKAQDEVQIAGLELRHAREKAVLEKDTLDFEIRESRRRVQRQELVVQELRRRVGRLQVVAGASRHDPLAVQRDQLVAQPVGLGVVAERLARA